MEKKGRSGFHSIWGGSFKYGRAVFESNLGTQGAGVNDDLRAANLLKVAVLSVKRGRGGREGEIASDENQKSTPRRRSGQRIPQGLRMSMI